MTKVGVGSVSSSRANGTRGSINAVDATNALDVIAEQNNQSRGLEETIAAMSNAELLDAYDRIQSTNAVAEVVGVATIAASLTQLAPASTIAIAISRVSIAGTAVAGVATVVALVNKKPTQLMAEELGRRGLPGGTVPEPKETSEKEVPDWNLDNDGPSKDPSRPGDMDKANSKGIDPYSGDGVPEGHSVPTAAGAYDKGVNDLSTLDQVAAQQQSKYGYVDGKYVELNGREPDRDRDDDFDFDNYDPPEPAETTTRDSEGGGGQVHEINHSNESTTTYTSSNDTYNDDGDLIAGGADIPLLLDLDGNGIQITELSQSTHFIDATGDGLKNRTAWAGAGDAVLFYDPNNLNDIVEKSQYAFSEWDPTAASDLEALRAVFDSNGDGVLDTSDAAFGDFKLMVTNADGSTRVMTLAAAGITGIDLTGDATYIELPDGSVITGQTTFTRDDGSTGTVGLGSPGCGAGGGCNQGGALSKGAWGWERSGSGLKRSGNFGAGEPKAILQERKHSIIHANGAPNNGRCLPSCHTSLG